LKKKFYIEKWGKKCVNLVKIANLGVFYALLEKGERGRGKGEKGEG
jgi:hypothetical protein